jgi:hypothetical protein
MLTRLLSSSVQPPSTRAVRNVSWRGPLALRTLLIVGICAVSLVAWSIASASVVEADADLTTLLHGMAIIKGVGVVAATGVLWWRFSLPLSPTFAAIYLVGIWLAAGATILIWHMTYLAAAAMVFHLCEVTMLVAACDDRRQQRTNGAAARRNRGVMTHRGPIAVKATRYH